MIDFREAQQKVLEQARSFGREELSLEQAQGRVLAETVLADRDYPPFNRAMMDGYAVWYGDLQSGIRRFKIAGTLFAGSSRDGAIHSGECYKIMTGAAVPEDADIVIRREDVEEMDGAMQLREPVIDWPRFHFIARQGEDLRSGATVIDQPCRCEPSVVGLLASLGKTTIKTQRLPGIALLTTGNEVVADGTPVSPVQIRNSNRWMLGAALKKLGIGIDVIRHVADDPDLLAAAIRQALFCDILIISGGVSAGDVDYVPGVLEQLGARTLFHKVAIRPGKPVWCGVAPSGGMIFALPGNPFSCLVNFVLLIRPFIETCWGLTPSGPLGLPLGVPHEKKTGLDEFFPVRFNGSPARLTPVALNSSGDIRLGMLADALALHPSGSGDLPVGAEVSCYPFA